MIKPPLALRLPPVAMIPPLLTMYLPPVAMIPPPLAMYLPPVAMHPQVMMRLHELQGLWSHSSESQVGDIH
jgi:hypothetical protein